MTHDLPLYIINRGRTRADRDVTAKVNGEGAAVLRRIAAQLN